MPQLQIDATQAILTFLGVVLSVVGFLILRAVSRVDEGIKGLDSKVEAIERAAIEREKVLAAQDTKILIDLTGLRSELAGLRTRLTLVEWTVLGKHPPAEKPE